MDDRRALHVVQYSIVPGRAIVLAMAALWIKGAFGETIEY